MLKNIQKTIQKLWMHIIIWGGMICYLFIAHDLYVYFFLQGSLGQPVEYILQVPEFSEEIKYRISRLDYIDNDLYALTGWAQYKTKNQSKQYNRYVVLSSDELKYYFPIKNPDKKFYIYISKQFINVGEYEVSFLFVHKDVKKAVYLDTNQIIVRTPNFLVLEEK
jgi:hypothetical protein